ncbi:MAG: NAD-dependent DNA ligase LigA [Cyclobacteriaceae bacterium]
MTELEAKSKIAELSKQVDYHNQLYYGEDRTEISDFEFDKLLQELIDLESKFPTLKLQDSPTQRVGGTITKSFETVYHKFPMLSLSNTYSKEELTDFHDRVVKGLGHEDFEYFCELKFDGTALSLTYKNGYLDKAVTRGDGTRGDNITTNAKTIRTIPLRLTAGDLPEEFEVRGEVFMPREVFDRINAEREDIGEERLANPRNTTSGTLKMQDSSVVASRNLDCFLYSVLGDDLAFDNHADSIDRLERWGFNVSPTYRRCSSIDEVFEYIAEWEMKRLELPLDTDGVVIKINNFKQREQLGSTAKSPRWAIAYKYKSESAATKLNAITYQVGRTGAITPVAELEPVFLAGTTVKRASLHNANEIARLDLRVGDTVFVEKGGEIIPKVTGVHLDERPPDSEPVKYIENCPKCDTELIRMEGEAVHYCSNVESCPPQVLGRLEHFIQRRAMNIESLGKETLKGLIDKGLVENPADLYDLTFETLNGLEFQVASDKNENGYSVRSLREKSAQNIIDSIEKSKAIAFEDVLFGIGIRFVGQTVAEKLADHFESIDRLMEASYEELLEAPEIGEKIAISLQQFFESEKNREFIDRLKATGLQMAVDKSGDIADSNILEGKTFVISGVFTNHSRDELKEMIKKNGGKNVSSVSAKLDYLVAGDNMGPSKLEKANKFGVKIISESEFETLLGL